MLKTIEIIDVIPYSITCKFNTGEVRKIDMKEIISNSNTYVDKEKLLNVEFFKKVSIGEFGELQWSNAAFMRDENNEWVKCEFDLSPEFVYHNSVVI